MLGAFVPVSRSCGPGEPLGHPRRTDATRAVYGRMRGCAVASEKLRFEPPRADAPRPSCRAVRPSRLDFRAEVRRLPRTRGSSRRQVCPLISRKHRVFDAYGPLCAELARRVRKGCVLDGEIVCFDDAGPQFYNLFARRGIPYFRNVRQAHYATVPRRWTVQLESVKSNRAQSIGLRMFTPVYCAVLLQRGAVPHAVSCEQPLPSRSLYGMRRHRPLQRAPPANVWHARRLRSRWSTLSTSARLRDTPRHI
jgi:hypothetical protein